MINVNYGFSTIAWSFLSQINPLYETLLALFWFAHTVDTPIIHIEHQT